MDRRLQDISVDTYLVESIEIIKKWMDSGKKNKDLDNLFNALLQINVYVAGLRQERHGYDIAIDAANKIAKQAIEDRERTVRDLAEVRKKLALYEL